jgi:hypothetical protein
MYGWCAFRWLVVEFYFVDGGPLFGAVEFCFDRPMDVKKAEKKWSNCLFTGPLISRCGRRVNVAKAGGAGTNDPCVRVPTSLKPHPEIPYSTPSQNGQSRARGLFPNPNFISSVRIERTVACNGRKRVQHTGLDCTRPN